MHSLMFLSFLIVLTSLLFSLNFILLCILHAQHLFRRFSFFYALFKRNF